MAKSLQDQLLRAGLVNENQSKKIKADKRKQKKQRQNSKLDSVDENQLLLQKVAADKAAKDRQLNLQKKQQADKKAIAAQIRQLIELNREAHDPEGVAYNFEVDGKVKTLYLSAPVRAQLVKGRLAIAKLDNRYELIPAAVAEKISQRDASNIISVTNTKAQNDTEDDPYADFQVPDDLMW